MPRDLPPAPVPLDDLPRVRAAAIFIDRGDLAQDVVGQLCDEIERLRADAAEARVKELEAMVSEKDSPYETWMAEKEAEVARLQERVSELEAMPMYHFNMSQSARIAALEAQLAVKDEALREAIRAIEMSYRSLRNSGYHGTMYDLRDKTEKLKAALTTTPAPDKAKP